MYTDPYKTIAKFYDFIFEPINLSLRQIGIKMCPISPGMKILDIGCGTGAQLELYKNLKCNTYGIDASPSMLEKAKERLGNSTQLLVTDAKKTPFPNDYFDLIVASFVLHEMPSITRALVLKEIERLLRKEGHILLTDYHYENRWTMKGMLKKSFITISEIGGGKEHFKNYREFIRRKGIPGMVENEPFEIVQSKIVSGGNIGLFILKKRNQET
jgi:demethylmenaquinone methyltransferase/2-methoxy-6-polyprenyl-1,4-benzoquinol methylase